MREAQHLGVVMSKDTAIAASKFNDEIKRLEASAQGFKFAIGKELIGPLTQLMQSMGDAATGPVSQSVQAGNAGPRLGLHAPGAWAERTVDGAGYLLQEDGRQRVGQKVLG